MGLILDSSVLITAERQGQNARQMLAAISGPAGNTEIAISVVTLVELAHGAARADTPARRAKRQQFIQELLTALPIHPITLCQSRFGPGKSTARTKPRGSAFRSPIY
jgi:predicted nucleic acid-binding protein